MTVTVYTLETCGNCILAKQLLNFKDISYNEVMIPQQMSVHEFTELYPSIKQFPFVVDETNDPIGGVNDLREWLLQREQRQLLNEQMSGLSI